MKSLLTVLLIVGATSASAFGFTDIINEGIADQLAEDKAALEAANEQLRDWAADQEKYWYCYDRGLTGNDLLGCKSQFDHNFGATSEY